MAKLFIPSVNADGYPWMIEYDERERYVRASDYEREVNLLRDQLKSVCESKAELSRSEYRLSVNDTALRAYLEKISPRSPAEAPFNDWRVGFIRDIRALIDRELSDEGDLA
jgi:hypothetical protein